MFLQNYDYEIQHRSGKRMGHMDALSRCSSILVLEGNTFKQTLSIKQCQDPEIEKICNDLKKTESKLFELRAGLVHRECKNNILFYVPECLIDYIIRTCHDDLGHIGLEKVSGKLSIV